jgi:predicted DNA-binding protein (MmcQ/YjbR family)
MARDAVLQAMVKLALQYPQTAVDHPWGDTVVKVKGKVFVFLGRGDDGRFGLSVKLPHSGAAALTLPWCEPTRYGLGKSGWVSASFANDRDVPMPVIAHWLDESYRAVAPKRLVATLTTPTPSRPDGRRSSARRSPPRSPRANRRATRP